jgi:hypothetical protein
MKCLKCIVIAGLICATPFVVVNVWTLVRIAIHCDGACGLPSGGGGLP